MILFSEFLFALYPDEKHVSSGNDHLPDVGVLLPAAAGEGEIGSGRMKDEGLRIEDGG